MNIINQAVYRRFRQLSFSIVLPLFILISMLKHFDIHFILDHWYILFGQFLFIGLGGVAMLTFSNKHRRMVFNMLSFQNSGYLPLPFILLLPDNGKLLTLLFIYLIGFNAAIFSISYWSFNKTSNLMKLLNPPIIATLISLIIGTLLAFFGLTGHDIPLIGVHLGTLRTISSNILIPMVMIVFGASLALHARTTTSLSLQHHLKVALIKYVTFPLIVFFIFRQLDVTVFMFMMIESIMPPAMNLLLIPKREADVTELSNLMFVQYLVFIVFVGPLLLYMLNIYK